MGDELQRGKMQDSTRREKKIAEAEEEKDLGLWVDTSMKPSKQCAAAAKAANFALGQMQRAFHYRTKETLIPIYKTFVRPKLEFAVAAWNQWMEMDKNALERVQQRMIRLISDAKGNLMRCCPRVIGPQI